MADRFPLIVNAVSKKIEEIVAGDNLELTNNGIVISGDSGAGKYLYSDGTTVLWSSPGDVYLTQSQTITNKTFDSCTISGTSNTLTNIPNTSLINSGITVNGVTVSLGGSITTPDNDTTYTIGAADAINPQEKLIRITGSDTSTDEVKITAGSNMSIARTGDTLILSSSYVDTDTVTRLQAYTGGAFQDGDVTIRGAGGTTVTQDTQSKTILVTSTDADTITRLRATAGQVYNSGDFTLLASGATSIAQGIDGNGDPTITYSSTDTITRLKGGGAGSFTSGDITVTGGTNVTVSQSGSTITVASQDNDTVTQFAANSTSLAAGDFRLTASGATTLTETSSGGVTTIEISSVNSDTGASLTASGGILLASDDFSLKNSTNFTGNTLVKWDSGNSQLANSLISDNGSEVTIGGDLIVTGTQTILETSTLIVEDNIIELRKGSSLVGADGGIQVNRTTDSNGTVVSYQQMQWYEAGSYWRSWDGSVEKRLVTETDTQVLSNKTLVSPTLTGPTLGAATATSINGLGVVSTASASININSAKSLEVQRSCLFTTDNNSGTVTVNFRNGGNVAYRSDTLASFSSTTSTQLRGLISDSTGLDRLVFQTSPNILTSLNTTSSTFNLLNSGAAAINFAGATTVLSIGSTTGTTTVNNDTVLSKDLTVGTTVGDIITLNGTVNSENADIVIRGSGSDPMSIGRGSGNVTTNTRVGVRALNAVTSGSQNTAFGYEAGYTINAGAANLAIGNRALRSCGIGNNNIALGRDVLLGCTDGSKNIAIGNNTLESATSGEANVCIGHYAGYAALGSGNVLIGPATNENTSDATYRPPNPGGDRQLVIGSGTEAWIEGNSDFKVTIPNEFAVTGDCTITGDLTVNGTTTSVNSNVMTVDDKEIELASVVNVVVQATAVNGNSTITGITPTTGLIPGMAVNSQTGGIDFGTDCIIVSITGNSAVLSNSVTGSGSVTFEAIGPSDTAANGGGLRLKGTTDKTITYDDSRADKYWTFSENLEVAFGKKFVIGNQLALSTTSIGSTVVNSSLTSVGTLVNLTVDGFLTIGGVVTEKVFNNYATTLTPASNVLTINVAGANNICGSPATQAINEWAFTGVSLSNGQSKTITLILDANTAATYGDDCTVDGNSVTNGVQWSGGSPPIATSNTDILTFIIMKDNAGITKVFGQGNTDFS